MLLTIIMGQSDEREHDDQGHFITEYSDDAILEALGEENVNGTQDVADAIDSSYETAYKKLQSLRDDGLVKSHRVANAHVWVLADE